MAKSSLEKTIEKQQKEAKRIAENEARQKRAASVVNGQPLIGNMRIMDVSSEEILRVLLSAYDGNDNRLVKGNYEIIPVPYQASLQFEFEKLNMYGMITAQRIWINALWELYITPQGISYFDDKEKAQQTAQATENTGELLLRKEYDVFISHASKDKSDYVDALYLELRKLGVKIFYDSEVLSWGDNWKQVIINGTSTSEFAILVISENFFGREWTERELQEFLQQQNTNGQKMVLPLLYNISLDAFKEKYPALSDIQVIETMRYSKEDVVILFAKELIKRFR